MKSPNIPLNDIAPLVEIHDYSLYYFIALALIITALAAASIFAIIKQVRKRKISIRKEKLNALRSVAFSDPKHAAYTISEIGRFFASDNERTYKAYQNLFDRLEPYKYAPQVEMIDEETIGYYRLYLEMIDA